MILTAWKNLTAFSVLAVTEAEESKFISTNYWSCWMLTLLSSWNLALSSAIAHLSVIFIYEQISRILHDILKYGDR